MKEKSHKLAEIVSELPHKPGIYQFMDDQGKIIYIGKARDIRKRVQSYFTKHFDNRKTAVLVSRIADIHYMVVETEFDAFLLENSLIKKYQPRYNIKLRDDKSFPWICIRNERFPRIYGMRNPVQDGSEYFGPYANVKVMNTLLELVTKLYPIRNCTLALTEENIEKKKFRICLEYQIGNCMGPCEGLQSEEDYDANIRHIRNIIKGNIGEVIQHLKLQMKGFADTFAFEKAQVTKEKLQKLEAFQAKSTVVNPRIDHVDVFAIDTHENVAYVNYLRIVNGAIVQTHTVELNTGLNESREELLSFAITDIRLKVKSDAREVILPFEVETDGRFQLIVPERGDKKKLLDLAERNVKYYLMDRQRQRLTKPKKTTHAQRILETLQKDLRMKELPQHIECFDNSNFQGHEPVAAMVVFKDAKPSKKDYRHFNIRTVQGPDDFASMEEIIFRRYKRMQDENEHLPQLIIIDGGKGQLGAALKSIDKLGLRGKMAIIGIAKKLEEIYFPGDSIPLYLDKKSESLKLIQQLRNEAHRFGITHHRNKRIKSALTSELDQVPGIGQVTRTKLLKAFGSVKGVRQASSEDLARVVGQKRAGIIQHFFSQSNRQG
ncbi:MAG: excinuclease ABC subunit C [Flavobacteriales bacterium]|nr:excinuclease ABC subunit C [Flavobacteriales bacterium]MCB9449661.1 excinuclease ABC subunit C [Flavobacteriales bacterium]